MQRMEQDAMVADLKSRLAAAEAERDDLRAALAAPEPAPAQADVPMLLRQAYRCGYSACGAGLDVTTRMDGDVHDILARAALKPAQAGGPGHTDLMVTPESVGPFLDANPAPAQAGGGVKKVEWDKGYLDALAENTRPLDGVDEPAQASDSPRPVCRCGCQDKMHDAGEIGSRRCNQPGCPCSDFAPAAPATGDVHTWERPSRVWVVAWPNARSAHFTEEARDHAAEPMPNGQTPVVTEYVPDALKPAQAGEAVAYEIIDAAGRHVAVRRTLQAAKSWVRAGTGWTVRPLVPAPSRPGGA